MLNIAEPVPPPESVPPIPETRSLINIGDLLDTDPVPPIPGIPWNSEQFRLHSIPGIPYRNYLLIPEISLQPQQYA
jgi:hypothetical protein